MTGEKIRNILSLPLVRNTLKLSSSNAVLYLLPLVVTPILSRLYSPDYFGAWGIFAGVFSIISVVMFGSYDNAIVKAPESDIIPLCLLSLLVGLCTIAITYLVFIIGDALSINFFLTFPDKWLLMVLLLIHGPIAIYSNLLNKCGNYNILAYSNLFNGGAQGGFRIIWRLITNIGNGLIIGTVLAHLTNLIFLLIKSPKIKVFNASFGQVAKVAKLYIKFPLYDAPALLLQFAALNLPVIILSFFFSRTEIGSYSLIVQLLILPISFIGSAMGKVYYQQLSSHSSFEQADEIRTSTILVLKILGYLCAIPCLFIGLGGDSFIVWFLGSKWTTAGNIAICMAIWSIPTILTESFKPLFRVKDTQHFLLAIEAVYFVGGIGIIILGCVLGWQLNSVVLSFCIYCALIKSTTLIKIFKLSNTSFRQIPILARILISASLIIISLRIVLMFADAEISFKF